MTGFDGRSHRSTLFSTKFLSIDLRVIEIIFSVHHDRLLRLFVVNLFLEFTGNAHPQRVGFYHRAFRNNGTGGDDAAFTDFGIVQDDAAHADEAAVADGAAMQRDRMPHGDPITHGDAVFVAHAVEHAAILHVGVFADADGEHVTTDHGVHPHAGVFTDFNIANDLGGLVDITRIMNARRDSLVRAKHKAEFLKVTRAADEEQLDQGERFYCFALATHYFGACGSVIVIV